MYTRKAYFTFDANQAEKNEFYLYFIFQPLSISRVNKIPIDRIKTRVADLKCVAI